MGIAKRLIWTIAAVVLFILALSFIATNIVFIERPATLFSFALVNFGGYLFFLLMPVEILFYYYLTIGANPLTMIVIAVATALIAQVIDYEIGKYFSSKVIDGVISKKRYKKYEHLIHKWGGPSIFLFNLFPLSSPILLLVAGIIKFNMRKALTYSAAGLIIKYSVIALVS